MTLSSPTIAARRATLADDVRAEIERWILSGELQSGGKLNEAALANVIGVSRGTVREAIRSLADSGLIDLVANRGAFVRRVTIDEVRNLYELRGAIFAMACASAARRAGRTNDMEFVRAMRRNLNEMRKAHRKEDREACRDLDINFHDVLLEAARNPKAKAVYDALVKEMHLFRGRGLSIMTNVESSISEHERIVEAVSAGDEERARVAGLVHIQSGQKRCGSMLFEGEPGDEADAR